MVKACGCKILFWKIPSGLRRVTPSEILNVAEPEPVGFERRLLLPKAMIGLSTKRTYRSAPEDAAMNEPTRHTEIRTMYVAFFSCGAIALNSGKTSGARHFSKRENDDADQEKPDVRVDRGMAIPMVAKVTPVIIVGSAFVLLTIAETPIGER